MGTITTTTNTYTTITITTNHTIPRHTTPHYTTPNHTTLHHTTPHHATLHTITLHHSTPQHSTPRHTTPHHTTPHHTTTGKIWSTRALQELHNFDRYVFLRTYLLEFIIYLTFLVVVVFCRCLCVRWIMFFSITSISSNHIHTF